MITAHTAVTMFAMVLIEIDSTIYSVYHTV